MMSAKANVNNLSGFINIFLSKLDKRHEEVIRARYGLDGSEPVTLQAIGDRYHITRERVRQIEAAALEGLRKDTGHPYFKSFIQTAQNQLKNSGSVQKEADFLVNLEKALSDRTSGAVFLNAATFLLELSGKFMSHHDNYNSNWHYHWYLNESDKKKAHSFINKLVSVLKSKKEEMLAGRKFGEVLSATARAVKISEAEAQNYLAISRKFGMNPFNEFGLSEWPEINPRTARDWAYLILKKEKKPLHFSQLSKIISDHRKDKRTNLQTVHNELIKDDRFVLVGRGLYGLKEFGLIPGTAREIIAHILKKNGPLPARQVVNDVLKQRHIKESTILINLQNKKHFDCRPDGRYCLREA